MRIIVGTLVSVTIVEFEGSTVSCLCVYFSS